MPANFDVPAILPRENVPRYGRTPLHTSHALTYLHGFIYCRVCGYYTSSARVQNLAAPCKMKPPNQSQVRVLKRMKAGLHPVAAKNSAWPRVPPLPADLAPYIIHDQ